MNKVSKTPVLTTESKILCFDIETNNLHGQPFAIGALIVDGHGVTHDSFVARCPIVGEVDEWVEANVIPVINDISQTHGAYDDMRESFWRWYLSVEPSIDYVLVSNGYPVEYSFLLDCQKADLENRYWLHPFPILDLTSVLVARAPNTVSTFKNQLRKQLAESFSFKPHNPVDDAKITALMAFLALDLLNIKA